jgi:hypothetical protein
MRKTLAAGLCAAIVAAGPAVSQATVEEPIPVPQDAPAGSSGPSGASMEIGSGALALVGLITVIAVGAVAVAASSN